MLAKKYIIDEKDLDNLLTAKIKLDFLCAMGLNNWSSLYNDVDKQKYLMERADGAFDVDDYNLNGTIDEEDDAGEEPIEFEDIAYLEMQDYEVYE
jgi:hypothetical protein